MRSNWVEWLVLTVSLAVIIGVAGFLVVEAILDDGQPASPMVRLYLDQLYETPAGWVLPATVSNQGDEPAEQVVLAAESSTAEGGGQESRVEVDYLPPGTSVEVAFAFAERPAEPVQVRLIGFRRP